MTCSTEWRTLCVLCCQKFHPRRKQRERSSLLRRSLLGELKRDKRVASPFLVLHGKESGREGSKICGSRLGSIGTARYIPGPVICPSRRGFFISATSQLFLLRAT